MADVNTNTFDDEETVENPVIQEGQKIRKCLPFHLLDDLRERTRHALRETVDLDLTSVTTSQKGRLSVYAVNFVDISYAVYGVRYTVYRMYFASHVALSQSHHSLTCYGRS